MIRSLMDRQREESQGMTRAELRAMTQAIADALTGESEGRVAEVLKDQFEAICQAEKLREGDAWDLLQGPWMLNALARQHYYSTAREILQGFYNWLRNEENEADLQRYRRNKY